MREKKERKNRYAKIEVDKEDLQTIKINCKGKRTVGKANKGINVEKIICFKKLKLKKEKRKKGKLHRTAKAQCRGRGIYQQ